MPAVELGHGGIAAKSQQSAPMAPSVANAALAVEIAVDEEFVIMMSGLHCFVPSSVLPGGAAAGDPLYIKAADNTIHLAADALSGGILQAGFTKWGLLDSIDTVAATCTVNLTERASF
jgi:hypothetical protein